MKHRFTAGQCSVCGDSHKREGQRHCLACKAAYSREWRKTHKLKGAARKRDIARHYAGAYQRRGHLVQEPCAACGSADSQKHHPDHELALLVVWLCRPCHLGWHAHWRSVSQKHFDQWLESKRGSNRKAA